MQILKEALVGAILKCLMSTESADERILGWETWMKKH